MSAYWGPAWDAEIAYRQEQVRAQFGRRPRRGRRSRTTAAPSTQVPSADLLPTGGPATAGPTPAIPLQRRAGTERPTPVAAGSTTHDRHKSGRAA